MGRIWNSQCLAIPTYFTYPTKHYNYNLVFEVATCGYFQLLQRYFQTPLKQNFSFNKSRGSDPIFLIKNARNRSQL